MFCVILSCCMKGYSLATLERQAFNQLAPHITLAPVMSPEDRSTLHSKTVKDNHSSLCDFIRIRSPQLTSLHRRVSEPKPTKYLTIKKVFMLSNPHIIYAVIYIYKVNSNKLYCILIALFSQLSYHLLFSLFLSSVLQPL